MRKFHRILLVILSVIGMGLSVCVLSVFYPVAHVSGAVEYWRGAFGFSQYVLQVYAGFVCLIFLALFIIAFIYPSHYDFLIMEKEKGKLYFSKKSIESTVRYGFLEYKEIDSYKIKVEIGNSPEKMKISVRLTLGYCSELAVLTQNVQNGIVSALEKSFGVGIKHVSVRIDGFKENTEPPKDTPSPSGDVSEVSL